MKQGRDNTLRILVVDDHDIVREGLKAVLLTQPGWIICGEAATGLTAVSAAAAEKPDVVIMDIHMPGMNGLEATKQILERLPSTRILILSAYESETLMRQMLASGARGYVLKADVSEDLILAVECVSKGRLYFACSISNLVLSETRRSGPLNEAAAPRPEITAREREVLQLLAEGLANKEIATALGISVRTVETHRSHLMNKLHAHSATDLVRWAVQNELIRLTP